MPADGTCATLECADGHYKKKKRFPKRFRELDPSCAEVGRRVCRRYAVYTPVGATLYYIGYTRTRTHTHTNRTAVAAAAER